MSAIEKIKQQVSENPVMLYMKGTPDMPMCGFSSRTVDVLKKCGKEFAYCNVILDQEVMREICLVLKIGLLSLSYISKVN